MIRQKGGLPHRVQKKTRWLAWLVALPYMALAEVPVDHIPNTLSLPETYPDSWVFVYSSSQPTVGIYAIVDVDAGTREYKGQIQGAFYPSLIVPNRRAELYVAESIFESVSHGKRTDVLSITNKATLNTVAQIVLPGSKRGILVGNIMDITHDGKWVLVLNFTPASSVTIVDAQNRKIVNEVPIPGCTSIYPSGPNGFSSLCGDGTLTTFSLGAKGKVMRESRSSAFNDIDHDVLSLQPASFGATTYFVSAGGHIRPVTMAGDQPVIQPSWPLITSEETADGWRPADSASAAFDESGCFYIRMYRETGYEKQARDNTEVWVYDVSAKRRIRRIPLKNGGTSMDITRGKKPYLAVTAETDPIAGESLDIYDAVSGAWIRSIGGWPPGNSLSLVQAGR